MTLRLIANAGAQTNVALAITAGATSIVGQSTANFPAPAAGQQAGLTLLDAGNPAYTDSAPLATPYEYAYYGTNTVGSGTLSGLVRGQNGTTAKAFFAGAKIASGFFAEDILSSTEWKFDEQTPSGVSSITIPASGTIPASYLGVNWRSIRIVLDARSTVAAASADIQIQFNGDTTAANYSYNQLVGNNSSASSSGVLGTIPIVARVPAANDGATLSGTAEILIPYAFRTSFAKTLHTRSMSFEAPSVASFWTVLRHANWNNTNAITSITLLMSAGNWAAGSIVSTYLQP